MVNGNVRMKLLLSNLILNSLKIFQFGPSVNLEASQELKLTIIDADSSGTALL